MPTKTILRTALGENEASLRFYLSGGSSDHPRCLHCDVTTADTEVETLRLENVTRDGSGNVTGRVANTEVVTQPQRAALRALLTNLYGKAVAQGGYA